jgi:hypothetical protein
LNKPYILNQRVKRKLKIFLAIFISCILVIEVLPLIYSSTTAQGIGRPIGDFGVLRSLDIVLQDKEELAKSPQIENETKNRLDQVQLTEYSTTDTKPDYEIKQITHLDYNSLEPIIFNALNQTLIVNFTTIFDFIFGPPLKYWIYTKSNNFSRWSEGMMRRTLGSLTKWVDIDVDGNLSNGNEISIRFEIEVDWDTVNILERTIRGGFGITINRLVNRSFPLELYIAKSISYEGENYIWNTGVEFDSMPLQYDSSLQAETLEFSGLGDKLIQALLNRNLANTTIAEINGPYSLRYGFNSNLKKFSIMAGLVKYENGSWTDKNWIVFDQSPAEGQLYTPRSGEVWVDSSNVQAPIDQLRWTAGILDQQNRYKIPVDMRITYGELREHLIMADVMLTNLPRWYSLKIDYTKVVKGNNVTVLDYEAAEVLKALNYTSYLYPDYQSDSNKVDCMHVLIEDVPLKFHMEMTSDIGRDINTTPYNNPNLGFGANLLNNIVVRIASRFYRIGKYLKLAAEGLLELPSQEGQAIIETYGEQFTNLEFYETTGEYIEIPGNFFGFLNITEESNGEPTNDTAENQTITKTKTRFAVSGRLGGLNYANISFGSPLEFEFRMKESKPFNGLFIDHNDYALASISNMPSYIKIVNTPEGSSYSTLDKDLDDDDKGTIIEEFKFITRISEQMLELKITQIPGEMEFNRNADIISFSTNENGYVKDLSYFITSDVSAPRYQLSSENYIFIYQDKEYVTSSGRLTGIKNLTFDQTEDGFIELNLNEEIPFEIMVVNKKFEHTKAKVIIDPIPSQFKIQLPGIIKQSSIDFPDMGSVSGFIDYSRFIFTLGEISNELVEMLGNLSQNFIESIGNIGFDFSISYELESFGSTLDMIAEIERGGIPKLASKDIYETDTDKVLGNTLGWTHGITMQQDYLEGSEILRGHLYLQGMPRRAELTTHFTENRTKVSVDFKEYSPRYDWLLIDLRGIQDRDVNVFFQKIPTDVDFYTSADLITNLEIGGEMQGDIDIVICDSGSDTCSQELGALYVNMHTYEPIQSIREMFISELPSRLRIDFALQKEMRMLYKASSEIEFIYSKLSKILTDSWHHVNLILHDLPKEFEFNLLSNTAFDIDAPLPLQGMPRLMVDTNNTNTLDILVSLDGGAVGQRNNIELAIQNVKDTDGKLENNWYKIKSKGLDFIRLKISELPILDNYKINSIVLEAEDLKALVFKVNLVFGVFPYFDLGSNSDGKIEIYIDHTIEIFGQKLSAQVALIDIVYETAGGARIPFATPMFINSINSDLKKTQNHVLVPAVLVTLVITWINNL